jgi:pSer/pThr/pTyr-binding forkhead associated (FHA) protein
MPEIVVKFDNRIVERIVTEKERLSIGRSSDNDIVLDNRGISRKHARIEVCGEDAIIVDNESLNGTFLNRRKIAEEKLRDNDTITIGKFDLEYHTRADTMEKMSDLDGTMILNTKKQKQMLKSDQEDKQLVRRSGCSVLVGLERASQDEVSLDRDMITVGKSKFVNVRVGGWFVSAIQARIVREGESFTIINVGKKGRTRVNGEEVTRKDMRNGDIIEVGNSVFRFVEAG